LLAVATLACGITLTTGVASVHRVQGVSMSPTFCPGAWLLVWHPGADEAAAGHVVVADGPGVGTVVKRVAALGGDTVGFDDGRLVRNGRLVPEPWLDRASVDGLVAGSAPVPPGTVYLLGDGRERSVDSRSFGAVDRSAVTGRVLAGVGGTCRA
jgi:signal peptidase I